MQSLFRVMAAGVACLFVSGCASDIMESYIGRDITDVVLDYGPPSNVVELPDGRTAFQWIATNTYTTPTTTSIYGYGNYATATTYGGTTSSYDCLYTLFARANGNNSYTVTGFKKPSIMCE